MKDIQIRTAREMNLFEFLIEKGFHIEEIDSNIFKVDRDGEIPVFINLSNNNIFFLVDLGSINDFASEELYFKLLDINTEILPVSVGVDSSNKDDKRLVLVESRETKNLDDNELLSVFDALEIAADKIEILLSTYLT
ncbi:MAG: hypothetical protein CR982_07675 [Candidatus Cloacimonadota bacterium]|nr:MAG: hypothetical protein CR982_07675 [Candidatus Cloacimonadota bacterium]PIE78266.1 MAG: hypothetical protein CSA15_08865 [Candidatus Delongbacteria bacterium]